MRILAVDIGTGTQDILLFDTHYSVENGLKLVMPSPTLRLAREVEAATRQWRYSHGFVFTERHDG